MVRFIHTADWQIGMTRHFLDAEAQPRFTAARIDAIRSITALADKHNCDFILVCGDVFESNHLNRQVVVRALDAMATSPVPIFLLPGNHDSLEPGSVFRSPSFLEKLPDQVRVIDSNVPIEVGQGVELVGAPWMSRRPLDDLLVHAVQYLEPSGDTIRILVGHGVVDEKSPDPDNPASISVADLEQHLERGVIQYVALGDRHSHTTIGSTGRILYSGTPEPTDYDEIEPGQVLVVDTQHDECTVEPVKVATWRFVDRRFDISGSEDLDILESWLDEQTEKDRTIARLAFVGTVSISQKARLDSTVEQFSDLYAAIEIWERRTDLAVLPNDDDFSDFGLSGFAASALEDLRGEIRRSGAEGSDARDALALLYRLSGETQ